MFSTRCRDGRSRYTSGSGRLSVEYQKGNITYSCYEPLCIICHYGTDNSGHYVIYNFTDKIIRISDLDIRAANESDVDVMLTNSILIFWSFVGFLEPSDAPGVDYRPIRLLKGLAQPTGRRQVNDPDDESPDSKLAKEIADVRNMRHSDCKP